MLYPLLSLRNILSAGEVALNLPLGRKEFQCEELSIRNSREGIYLILYLTTELLPCDEINNKSPVMCKQ